MSSLNIIFRVDSASTIGIGHTVRCIALAQQMDDCKVFFLSAELNGNANNLIKQSGFEVINIDKSLPENLDAEFTVRVVKDLNIDVLVVDHYGLGGHWESYLYDRVKLVAIDDLPDREHKVHLLTDSGRQKKNQGDELALFGHKYCLLRKDFLNMRYLSEEKRARTEALNKILISFGGTDTTDLTQTTIKALREYGFSGEIGVLASSGINSLSELQKMKDIILHLDKTDVAKILYEYDLVVGALGGSSWERCCMGLPSISIKVAENQSHIETVLIKEKVSIVTGTDNSTLLDKIESVMSNSDFSWWKEMSKRCFALCDGYGAYRVAERIKML